MDNFALAAIRAWNQRPRPQFRLIDVKPINPTIGAEISGVDLSKDISPELFAELNAALVEYQVIVFRDQDLSPERHKAFGRLFGKLHSHPGHSFYMKAKADGDQESIARYKQIGLTDDTEILAIAADETSKNVAGEGWHTDATFETEPPMGSLLYITELPGENGGATMFMNSHLAYETLSESMKAYLEGLTAVHSAAGLYSKFLRIAPPPGVKNECEHPIVVRHPVNGRKMLYVNFGLTSHIPQLAPHESDALLQMLYRHCETMVELHCRVQWTPNTLTFWDNRATQHHAVWDYFPNKRIGRRVSVLSGWRPSA